MREIKFRAWSKKKEAWCYETVKSICDAVFFNDISPLDLNNSSMDEELFEIYCQFTGLIDKLGKEIYEGDILRFYYNDKLEFITEVKWFKGGWWQFFTDYIVCEKCKHPEATQSRDWLGDSIDMKRQVEVIGNIYENANLLTPATKDIGEK